MKKFLLLLVCCSPVFAQVSPIGALGSIQLLDNNGNLATSGCFYFYQASTSTQQATFTDASGSVQNPNPLCVGLGARAIAWLTTGNFYRIVACISNDGPNCNSTDVLWSQDQVPGGAQSSGGGGSGPPFVTSSANPATTGVLRCASGDTCVAFRNTANSANLTLTKDTNDLLSWSGGSIKLPEVGTPTSVTGFDILNPNSTAHRFEQCSNGSACAQIVDAGVDVNTSDQVTQLHFGSTPTPLSGTAPTTGQVLQWNATNVVGYTDEHVIATPDNLNLGPGTFLETGGGSNVFFLSAAHTLTRLGAFIINLGSGCSGAGVVALKDVTAASNISTFTLPTNPGASTNQDSGALSVSMPAGHLYALILSTGFSGCGSFPGGKLWMLYQ